MSQNRYKDVIVEVRGKIGIIYVRLMANVVFTVAERKA